MEAVALQQPVNTNSILARIGTRKAPKRALLIVAYGLQGIGKSTSLSTLLDIKGVNPVFIDFENRMGDIDRISDDRKLVYGTDFKTFDELLSVLKELKTAEYNTVAFDVISGMEELLWEAAAKIAGKSPRELQEMAHGAGYKYPKSCFALFMTHLNALRDLGKRVIITDHETARIFEPDGVNSIAYERVEPMSYKSLFMPLYNHSDYVIRFARETKVSLARQGKLQVVEAVTDAKVVWHTDQNVYLDSFLKKARDIEAVIRPAGGRISFTDLMNAIAKTLAKDVQ